MKKEDLIKSGFTIPGLFAYDIDADCHRVNSEASGFSYKYGIPSSYSSLNGKKVCRSDINGLGMSITHSRWFNQLGGYYTFSQEVSDLIGGYPLGAVLHYKEESTGKIREVRSLIQNNNFNFVVSPEYINDEYWSFVDNVPCSRFRPRIFPSKHIKEGTLLVNQPLFISSPCMFTIQTGISSMDCTKDGEDFILFITVQSKDDEEFHTAGTIAYLPALPSILAQGIISNPGYDEAAVALGNAFHSYCAPSSIQLFLSAGDTIKLTGNREFTPIEEESFHYWITSLES